MSSWNSPAQLLEQTDLILVAREMQEVMISADPKDMFGALKHFCLEERVSVKYKDQELLPAELGNFENTKTSDNALLLLLPALKGDDEHLSSTQLRRSMTDLLGTMKLHGCCEELMVSMLHSTLESPKALAQNTALAIERGEAVVGDLRRTFGDQKGHGLNRPTLAAMPQFSMIGPLYLQVYKLTDSRAAAVLAASIGESALTFAPQRRNAQIQYNAVRPAQQHLAITPMRQLSGLGISAKKL
eukprot:symbB.v1.2.034610.t1/scaffold4501.1/size38858/1